MRFKKVIITAIIVAVPLSAFFLTMTMFVSASSDQEPYSIFIVAGQSNAEGTNSFTYDLPAGTGVDKASHPADASTGLWIAGADGVGPVDLLGVIWTFSGNSAAGWWDSNDGTGNKLRQLTYQQRAQQFGPELGIARHAYEMGRRKMIILKVTYGFQSLAPASGGFIPFDWNIHSTNKSYARLKNEFKLLTDKIKADGHTYTVDGFFWQQGETDTLQESFASTYQQNFTEFTNAVRTDFQMHPASHIVAGKISLMRCVEMSYPDNVCGFPSLRAVSPSPELADFVYAHPQHGARMQTVRRAFQYVADNDQNYPVKVDTVETADIPRGADAVHLNAAGQLELGRRFINMYALPQRLEGSNDYDGDGIPNNREDTGTSGCHLVGTDQGNTYNGPGGSKAGNGNLGDDDCDNDGYPNYLDRINGRGSGL